jgi:hypothetical protein
MQSTANLPVIGLDLAKSVFKTGAAKPGERMNLAA